MIAFPSGATGRSGILLVIGCDTSEALRLSSILHWIAGLVKVFSCDKLNVMNNKEWSARRGWYCYVLADRTTSHPGSPGLGPV